MSSPESIHDSQCNEEEEQIASVPRDCKSKPHTRACESCRTRKIRCLPQDDPETGKCQRCTKSGRECIYTAPEKRRRRKRTDARVADLEHMVRMLAARLEDEQRARQQQTRDSSQRAHSNVNAVAGGKASQASTLSSRLSADSKGTVPDFLAPSLGKSKSSIHQRTPSSISSAQQQIPNDTQAMESRNPNNVTPCLHHPMTAPELSAAATSPIQQPFSAWPLPDIYLKPSQQQQQHQHQHSPTQETLCSPCPSHSSSTSTVSSTLQQDSSSSYFSPYMSTTTDFTNPYISCDNTTLLLPEDAMAYSSSSMDAAISARLNLPCSQDQGIWWPQSNIMVGAGAEGQIGSGSMEEQMSPMVEGGWIPEEDLACLAVPQWG
ncbi:MAG: hypothetical protein Q9220_004354 [cf. Caloplaca sp. 1 TL-2023]